MKASALTLSIIFCIGVTGCEDYGGPPPRIVLWESIDGVRLGDTREQVVRVLGQPSVIGYMDGATMSWDVLYYYWDPSNGNGSLRVEVITAAMQPGIVDHVSGLGVRDPYEGKTRDGLGLGSSRSDVLRILGPPVSSESTDVHDRLEIFAGPRNTQISLWYTLDKVAKIHMGWTF